MSGGKRVVSAEAAVVKAAMSAQGFDPGAPFYGAPAMRAWMLIPTRTRLERACAALYLARLAARKAKRAGRGK